MSQKKDDFYIDGKRRSIEYSVDISKLLAKMQDNDDADKIDKRIKEKSENNYMAISRDIVDASTGQLEEQNQSKNTLKQIFMIFFIVFISVQYCVLAFLLILKSFWSCMNLSDTVIITYITSVFVETLSAIIVMIRYAFNSEQEVKILQILNNVISSYKKFDEGKLGKSDEKDE